MAGANVSQRTAHSLVDVIKAVESGKLKPEALADVRAGLVSLKQTLKKVAPDAAPKSKKRRPAKPLMERVVKALTALLKKFEQNGDDVEAVKNILREQFS